MSLISLYIRSFIYTVCMFLSFVLLCSIAVLPSPLISESKRWSVAVLWSEVNIFLLKKICGLEYVLKGTENMPSEKCVVFLNIRL